MKCISIYQSLFFLSIASSSYGFNYHELHVYGYQTEGKGVIEIENSNSFSNNQKNGYEAQIVRNSLEFNYGLRDWIDAAIYADFINMKNSDENQGTKFAGTRYRLHARFLEKGEQSVDLGAYLEVGIPQEGDAIYEVEFKPIIEKDFDRWTFILNPILEYELEEEKEVNALGEEETEQKSEFEMAYAMAMQWRIHSRVLPSLNLFGDFADNDSRIQILQPQIDIGLSPWSVAIGLGFGLTPASEKRILHAAVEVEI